MRAELENTKNIEDVIRETADEVQEECLDEMIMFAEQLRKRKAKKMQRCLEKIVIVIMDYLFYKADKHEEWIQSHFRRDEGACLVMNIIYESVYIGYPGGKTYEEFLRTVFGKAKVTLSDSEIQRWNQRYRRFCNTQSKQTNNFERSLYAYKINRQLKEEGNKIVEGTYYKSVLPFQEAAREYDILCYPWNKAGDQAVFEALDKFAVRRFKGNINLKQEREKFKKMIQQPFQTMDKNDIEMFMIYIKNKCYYIEQYEDPLFKNIGQWAVLKESGLKTLAEYSIYSNKFYPDFFYMGGCILCELIHRIMQEAGMETETLIWREVIRLANRQQDYAALIADFLTAKVVQDSDINKFREEWKDTHWFITEKARRQIRDSFVSKYLDQNQKIEDFMEICFCCDEISYDVEEVCKLAKVFQQIFCFLQECVKKEDQLKFNAAEEILSNKEPLEKLKNSLGSESLMTDSLETSFVVNAKSNSYFKKVYEKRYVYLEYYIDNFYKQQQKEPFKEAEELAGRYLKGILKEDPKVRIKIKRTATEDIILNKLIKLLYPNYLWHEDTQKLYDTKERLLNLAEKYGFVEEIWFEEENL